MKSAFFLHAFFSVRFYFLRTNQIHKLTKLCVSKGSRRNESQAYYTYLLRGTMLNKNFLQLSPKLWYEYWLDSLHQTLLFSNPSSYDKNARLYFIKSCPVQVVPKKVPDEVKNVQFFAKKVQRGILDILSWKYYTKYFLPYWIHTKPQPEFLEF